MTSLNDALEFSSRGKINQLDSQTMKSRLSHEYHGSKLCEPDLKLLEKSHHLREFIQQEIARNQGIIPFSEYMSLALYAPELGYYSGNMPKFGFGGDFITAPEISPLFSQCLASFCQDVLRNLKDEHNRCQGDILEIGAGSGQMALDILVDLYHQNSLPRHYYIFEISPTLKKRQELKLKEGLERQCGEYGVEIFSRIIWIDAYEGFFPKTSFQGIILANEFLDALPVELFTIKEGKFYFNYVVMRNGKFELECREPETHSLIWQSHDEIQHLLSSGIDYQSEINFNLEKNIENMASILNSGVVLLIDYGFPRQEYYHPDRTMGTLMCHYQHRAHHDPFYYPGLQDITAHVDFTAVALAAQAANLEISGYTTQANFLIDAGLIHLLERQRYLEDSKNNKSENLTQHSIQMKNITQNQAINILTSPAEMGELFKVIALSKNYDKELIGFRNDLRNRL